MAKQDFPGLVLVPPSDREIAKRRLARWTFILVGIICGISTLNAWLAPPDPTTDCQPSLDLDTSPDSRNPCNQTDSAQAADEDTLQGEITVAAASQEPAPIEPPTPKLAPPPKINQPITQTERKQAAPTVSNTHTTDAAIRPLTPLREERQITTQTAAKPVSTPTPDAHLAERGDAFAQYRLGKFYAKQSGPEAPESVSWYMKASSGLRRLAETGNGEAMYVLGVMYAFGRGVQKDTEEARHWLTRAVEHQVAAARPVLASLERHRLAERDRTDNGG
ncbi:MAG: sel1 repeat family protein [Nitrospira sp.]|nr:sel1 repeat family protein [Nitrospira sp.]